MKRELEAFLYFFCKYYTRFPDNIFDVVTIHDPLLLYALLCAVSVDIPLWTVSSTGFPSRVL